jgi:hypothetical protein
MRFPLLFFFVGCWEFLLCDLVNAGVRRARYAEIAAVQHRLETENCGSGFCQKKKEANICSPKKKKDDVGFVSPLSRPSEALGFAIDPPSHSQIAGAYEELFK